MVTVFISNLQRYDHLKVLQIWLKIPIPAPKIYVSGGLIPKHYFSSIETPKATTLRATALYELSCVKIGSAIFYDRAMRPMYGCPENFRESMTTRCNAHGYFPRNFDGLFFRLNL